MSAFADGMTLAACRTGRGGEWPLSEFMKDKIAPFRKIMDTFTEPLLKEALAKREREITANKGSMDAAEEETLLAHLVKETQGLFHLR